MVSKALKLYLKRDRNLHFLNPPKYSDAVGKKRAEKYFHLNFTDAQELKRIHLLHVTGKALSNVRIGHGKELTFLRKLPKGYYVSFEANNQLVIYGHPSGIAFKDEMSFIPHLLWLEEQGSRRQSKKLCKCRICIQLRKPTELKKKAIHLSSLAIVKNKMNTKLTTRTMDNKDMEKIYKCYKVTKVCIKPPSSNIVRCPKSIKIPLPKILQPDLSILRFDHKDEKKKNSQNQRN
ncbi:uncharacterized protein BX663DRAFT_172127 [Cokeromyces recurvatus]|uniref:uncharacterized protein n=1 Tax=Cokeromyces recurvatus TaxID=90255 RepID=UPI002220337E|nr:uncharacterized protein BX663DRAFT_172127 [Cokeromyces recurvatus]KAI7900006.1 hypothetical protein BX663DRAFT_172127 [Cokeromyces recurvatus]